MELENYIKENWDKTARLAREDDNGNIGLPYRYFVPSIEGGFCNLFYWDSFFTAQGMFVHGKEELVKSTVDDMLYLIDCYGYMPNGNAGVLMGRSQPPFLCELVFQLYQIYKDPVWLRSAYDSLKKEYQFWMRERSLPCGLNRYGFFVTPENTDMGIEVSKRLSGLDFSGFTREKIAENIMADAESGWDFSPRCEMHQIECAYVDLNSILYRNEMNMAYFAEVLGKKEEKEWKQAALLRRQRMEQYLFDGNVYLDYNVVRQEHSPIFSVASFYPLWAGVATTEQAKKTVENLHRLEYPYGISTCEKGVRKTPYQWDYPNGWAPLQYIMVHALERYGYREDAKRIAHKYIDAMERIFAQTGTLGEKYNVTNGSLNVTNEYHMPPMLGWTAGVYVDFKEYVKKLEMDEIE